MTPPDGTVRLDTVRPNGSVLDRPKGLWPYRPHAKTRPLVDRILERYRVFDGQDALPAGPRTVGYRLSEVYRGQYSERAGYQTTAGPGQAPLAISAVTSANAGDPGGLTGGDR
jgi:hypothetical protein